MYIERIQFSLLLANMVYFHEIQFLSCLCLLSFKESGVLVSKTAEVPPLFLTGDFWALVLVSKAGVIVICNAHACARALPWHKCRGAGHVFPQSKGSDSHQKGKLRISTLDTKVTCLAFVKDSSERLEEEKALSGELLLLKLGLGSLISLSLEGKWDASFLSLRNCQMSIASCSFQP